LLLLYIKKDDRKHPPKFVRIIDLKEGKQENKVLYNAKVTDKELIGRLTSMLYCFIDGHIYYNSSVIKIRYDLLESKTVKRDLSEYEVFDYFHDILCHDEKGNETV